jgi:hypothetical protein
MAARGRDLLQCLADVPAYSPVDFEDRALILRRRPLRPLQGNNAYLDGCRGRAKDRLACAVAYSVLRLRRGSRGSPHELDHLLHRHEAILVGVHRLEDAVVGGPELVQ